MSKLFFRVWFIFCACAFISAILLVFENRQDFERNYQTEKETIDFAFTGMDKPFLIWYSTSTIGVECTEFASGTGYVCGTHVHKNVKWHYDLQTIEATITSYSRDDFPSINAMGKMPLVGMSIACARRIPFGTQITFQKESRRCDDRLALKYDARFDRFVRNTASALEWGKRKMKVTIHWTNGY